MDDTDRDAINAAVFTINTIGRDAAEYLYKVLREEDNAEASAWIEDYTEEG